METKNERKKGVLGIVIVSVFFVLVVSGCVQDDKNGVVPPGSGKDAFCGSSTNGECVSDSDCITGGCSSSVCQSVTEESKITTCEWKECYDAKKYGVTCNCVGKTCQWS